MAIHFVVMAVLVSTRSLLGLMPFFNLKSETAMTLKSLGILRCTFIMRRAQCPFTFCPHHLSNLMSGPISQTVASWVFTRCQALLRRVLAMGILSVCLSATTRYGFNAR